MKRRISIFAFLLSAFAAVGLFETARGGQNVFGGYFCIGETNPTRDQACMSPYSVQDLVTGDTRTFTAKPRAGLEVSNWGKCTGESWPSDIQVYTKIKWNDPTLSWNKETCVWTADESEWDGALAVRFDYTFFDVTFDINGGTSKKPDDIEDQNIDSTIPLPSVTRDGYDFAGWKNAKGDVFRAGNTSGEAFWDDDDRKFYADLTAQWTGKAYAVTIDPNDGTGGECDGYTVSGKAQTRTVTPPTREGHTIQSWQVSGATGGSPWVNAENVLTIPANTYGDLTLTPEWKADTFTITYKPGSGTPGNEYTDTKTWGVSKALRGKTYNDPKGQYVQDGWNTNDESFEGEPEYGLQAAYTENASITLFPHWKLNGYKLTIHHKGAYYDGKLLEETALESLVVGTTNLNEILVAVPTNDAAFYGYYSTEGGSTQIYDEHGKCCKVEGVWSAAWPDGTFAGSANLEVWAKWGPPPEHCNISAVCDPADGGTVDPASTNVVKGRDVTLIATPNAGYSFCCWTNEIGDVISLNHHDTFTVTNNATYTAVFTGNVYTVAFYDMVTIPLTPQNVFVTFGSDWPETPKPKLDGYDFLGWFTDAAGGQEVKVQGRVNAEPPSSLYAHWGKKTKFDVVWRDLEGGNVWVTNQDVSVNTRFEQADPQTANWPEKRDYKYWIKGWDPALPVTVVDDTTITAVWESYANVLDCPDSGLMFDVRANWMVNTDFCAAGDSCLEITSLASSGNSITTTVREPGTFEFQWKAGAGTSLYAEITRKGQTHFDYDGSGEWKTETIVIPEASAAHPVDIRFTMSKEHLKGFCALDAVTWTPGIVPQKRTITVDAGEHGSATGGGSFDLGADVTLTATADLGYAFCCWTNETGFATNANPWTFKVVDDASYTVTFTNCQYLVTLDPNGGTGGEAAVLVTYDADLPTLDVLPHRDDGASFLGYFDQTKDGTQYYKADGTGLRKWDKTTDAATLYAQWKAPDMFTLTVTSAGHGSVAKSPDQTQYVSGTKVEISATPDAGYAFEKWSDESTEASRTITVTADATYTATFTACVYRVTFDANGGVQPTPEAKNVTFNAKYGTLAETTRSGYDFAGWTLASGDAITAETIVKTAADHELVAQWKQNMGEVSAALDCNNLMFKATGGWTIHEDPDFAYTTEGGNDLYLKTDSADNGESGLSTTVTAPGQLTFYWRAKGDGLDTTDFFVFVNGVGKEIVSQDDGDSGWVKETIAVTADALPATIRFACDQVGSFCAIDDVTWTPEGGGEPTPGDPVAVTAAGVTDGVFSLTISAESGDYGVWTNADLTIDSWGLMGEPQKGEGKPLEFKWTILPGFPQLFFRAHKVEYK